MVKDACTGQKSAPGVPLSDLGDFSGMSNYVWEVMVGKNIEKTYAVQNSTGPFVQDSSFKYIFPSTTSIAHRQHPSSR